MTCYPPGAFYTKHYDNAIGNGRKLTAILYLNKEWQSSDGGQVKLYQQQISGPDIFPESAVVVEPLLGRLLLFWSDTRCPHEVYLK